MGQGNKPLIRTDLKSTKRITSIDALRAFALLGILLVHTAQLYNFYQPDNDFSHFSSLDNSLRDLILNLFENKCRTIFSILFGASFYLILRNPQNSIIRFCWRCILLMGFGIINQIAFSTDILTCYGFTGIVLALLPIRKLQPTYLFMLAAIIYILQFFPLFDIQSFVFPQADYTLRYSEKQSLYHYLSYPLCSILKDNTHVFSGGIIASLSYFIFGYALGRSGYIEKIHLLANLRNICYIFLITIFLRIICKLTGYSVPVLQMSRLSTSLCYAILFIRLHMYIQQYMYPMECYGKLGLTNYSTQNICCPLFILGFALPRHLSFAHILFYAIIFFLLQIFFAVTWLKHHKYGPWEYVWRKMTNIIKPFHPIAN